MRWIVGGKAVAGVSAMVMRSRATDGRRAANAGENDQVSPRPSARVARGDDGGPPPALPKRRKSEKTRAGWGLIWRISADNDGRAHNGADAVVETAAKRRRRFALGPRRGARQ